MPIGVVVYACWAGIELYTSYTLKLKIMLDIKPFRVEKMLDTKNFQIFFFSDRELSLQLITIHFGKKFHSIPLLNSGKMYAMFAISKSLIIFA